jgi:hypothetical protein
VIRLKVGRARSQETIGKLPAVAKEKEKAGVSGYAHSVMAGTWVSVQAADALVCSESLAVGDAVTHGRTPWRGFASSAWTALLHGGLGCCYGVYHGNILMSARIQSNFETRYLILFHRPYSL